MLVNFGKREINFSLFLFIINMRSQTVIIINWKLSDRTEAFVNLGKLYTRYNSTELGVSRWTLDRKDLYEGYENEIIQIKKLFVS